MKVKWLLVTLVLLLFSTASAVAQKVTVINIIPQKNSNEANDDSEPNIAVNPANPLQIAATAFTPDSSGATNKVPIFLSSDGGQNWTEASIVPVNANSNCPGTCDITLRFGGSSNILYISWLDGKIPPIGSPSIEYSILRTTPFPGPAAVTVLENIAESTSSRDQPFTQATTVTSAGTGNDHLYVGSNDAAVNPKSATVDQSMNAGTPPPPAGLSAVRPEVRTNCGFDGPPIRPAIHSNGTVYAVFSSWTTCSATSTVADVVLVRDDNWGQGSPAYSAIKDSSDNKAGVKVASGIAIPFNTTTGYANLGTERVGSLLSIAVDPRNSQTVYVAWGTGTSAANYKLNVARSDKGGISGSWTTVLTVSAATNPSLAVTNRGTVGFLYQKLVTPGTCNAKGTATACWETHLQTSDNSGNAWTKDFTLANLPDSQATSLIPSIGDYDHLLAIGKDFYGVFSGFNAYATPTTTNFPQNISFQRFTDNAGNFFADAAHTTSVSYSVDPFFFQVSEPDPTTLTYQGDTSADFHDPANLAALLTDQTNGQPVPNVSVKFTLGSQVCTATTNASGVASCTVVLDQCSGSYTVKANFAGTPLYLSSSDSKPFTVNLEETTLTYTGDTVIANGGTAKLSGVLLEDNTTPVAGRTVTFSLGTGGSAQTCNAVTNGSGIASCTISPVAQPLGPGTVTDSFAGDACYRPASASAKTILFAFLASGAFVVGDQSGQVGAKVTFWSAKWSRLNKLSGGAAPASFKGFAATLSSEPPMCGITWTTGPGNSSQPPATVPEYMGVLASSKVTKSGPKISGDAKSIVVVKTDPGYAPNPGHAGTGAVVAVFCHP